MLPSFTKQTDKIIHCKCLNFNTQHQRTNNTYLMYMVYAY